VAPRICLESFHGNQQSAVAQAQSGLVVLSEWQAQGKIKGKGKESISSVAPVLDPDVEVDMGMIFDRLYREVWTFGQDTRPIEQQKSMYKDGYLASRTDAYKVHLPERGETIL
jgi:hypothetical protein